MMVYRLFCFDSIKYISILFQHLQFLLSLAFLFFASSCNLRVSYMRPVGCPVLGFTAIYRFTAFAPSSRNAFSTLTLFLALDSKKIMFPFCWQNFLPSSVLTLRCSSRSTLFPITKKGNVSAFYGCDFVKKTCFQSSRWSNETGLVTSYTRQQQSAPR